MTKNTTQKLTAYAISLENVNEQLGVTRKQCVKLLNQFQISVHDRAGWKKMMVQFRETIANAENHKSIRQFMN